MQVKLEILLLEELISFLAREAKSAEAAENSREATEPTNQSFEVCSIWERSVDTVHTNVACQYLRPQLQQLTRRCGKLFESESQKI
mgnify:CR=1 FL=1